MYQILPMNMFVTSLLMIVSFMTMMFILNFIFITNNKENKKTEMKIFTNKNMLSLFVSFEPASSVKLFSKEMNWFIMTLIIIILFLNFWTKPNRLNFIFMSLMYNLGKQFEISLKTAKDGSKMTFITLFLFILLSNLVGLIPNSFTSTSHMTVNLFFSIPMWLGFMMFGFAKFFNMMMAHLVPNGTPVPLISFMVLIEMTSSLIRPLTLSIRLMANMVSGHLLMTLLGNTFTKSSIFVNMIFLIIQTTLFSLELSVAIIQAYVFCMLLTIYSDECDYTKN